MQFRAGRPSDFTHLETFVWQAIFPTFDREGLTEEQRQENDVLVEQARPEALAALEGKAQEVLTAWDERRRALAGYLVLDRATGDYATIRTLIVRRSEWGKGVGEGLLAAAQEAAGPYTGLQVAVRSYTERALAFFQKQGFENTGEAAGDYAIERILLLREPPARPEPVLGDAETLPELDLLPLTDLAPPTDEPEPPYFDTLPDYTLATDAADEPLFPPEESTLDEQQRTTLEDFIARAKAIKQGKPPKPAAKPETAPPPPAADLFSATPPPVEAPAEPPLTRHPEIELEIANEPPPPPSAPAEDTPPPFEFAFSEVATPPEKPDAELPPTEVSGTATTEASDPEDDAPTAPLDFEFAFGPATEPPPAAPPERHCPNCLAVVPPAAHFCPNCGHRLDQETDVLELGDLPEEEVATPTETELPPPEPTELTVAEMRSFFEDRLGERLTAYFGADRLPDYIQVYREDALFRQIRDVSLRTLTGYLNREIVPARARRRRDNVLAGLVEYFVVESASALHGNTFPQRLLRYQGVDWKRVDLFKLVMDYLDLDRETERVYTDFLTTPARVLRNATQQYLKAGRDERVLLICDQSLLGNGKHGFALTDAALYWKNMLQPAGVATYTTIQRLAFTGKHLTIDSQYFDAGNPLNLRIALLLDKLQHLDLRDE